MNPLSSRLVCFLFLDEALEEKVVGQMTRDFNRAVEDCCEASQRARNRGPFEMGGHDVLRRFARDSATTWTA
jgi:hypothetical protein